MKKILIIFIFLTVADTSKAIIPVIDNEAIINEAIQFARKLKKWKNKVNELLEQKLLFKKRFGQLKQAYTGYRENVIGRIKYILKTSQFNLKSYWYDVSQKDIWSKLFKGGQIYRLKDKYQALDETETEEVVKKNIYYKKNKRYREYIEEKLKNEKDYIENIQNIINQIGFMRLGDRYRKIRFDFYEKRLKQWAEGFIDGNTLVPTSYYTRLLYLWASIRFDKLLLKQEINYLLRSFLELNFKKEIYFLDHKKRLMIFNKEWKKNIDLIKDK